MQPKATSRRAFGWHHEAERDKTELREPWKVLRPVPRPVPQQAQQLVRLSGMPEEELQQEPLVEAQVDLSVVPRVAATPTPCTGVSWKNAYAIKGMNPLGGVSAVAR